ncbi:unnamed protein product, partial [Choristocarpus tenellus]
SKEGLPERLACSVSLTTGDSDVTGNCGDVEGRYTAVEGCGVSVGTIDQKPGLLAGPDGEKKQATAKELTKSGEGPGMGHGAIGGNGDNGGNGHGAAVSAHAIFSSDSPVPEGLNQGRSKRGRSPSEESNSSAFSTGCSPEDEEAALLLVSAPRPPSTSWRGHMGDGSDGETNPP